MHENRTSAKHQNPTVLPPSGMQGLGAITRTKKPEQGERRLGPTATVRYRCRNGEVLEVRGSCCANDQHVERAHCGDQVGSLGRCEKIRQMSPEQGAAP